MDARDRRCAQLRAREVVQDDPRVIESLLCVPVRTPLAETDAVSPTVAGDEERRGPDRRGLRERSRARTRRRAGDEHENGDEYEGSTHRADPSKDATEASKGPHEQHLSLRNPHLIVYATMSGGNPKSVSFPWL